MNHRTNRVVAVMGLVLHAGAPIGLFGLMASLLWASSTDITASAGAIVAGVRFTLFGQGAVLAGFSLLAWVLFGAKYRAPWLLRWGRIAMYCLAVAIPIGTVAAILMLDFFRKHQDEFAMGERTLRVADEQVLRVTSGGAQAPRRSGLRVEIERWVLILLLGLSYFFRVLGLIELGWIGVPASIVGLLIAFVLIALLLRSSAGTALLIGIMSGLGVVFALIGRFVIVAASGRNGPISWFGLLAALTFSMVAAVCAFDLWSAWRKRPGN